jgi:hypothetical protein
MDSRFFSFLMRLESGLIWRKVAKTVAIYRKQKRQAIE